MVSFTITTGWKRWYVFGAYVLPNDQPAVYRVVQALVQRTVGAGNLLVGYLNDYLVQPRDQREEDPATVIADHGFRM